MLICRAPLGLALQGHRHTVQQIEKTISFFEHYPLLLLLLLLLIVFYIYIRLQNSDDIPSLENSQKRKAKYPPPNKDLLSDTPQDCIVLGKWGSKYVCKPLTEGSHLLVVGGSGAGKSSSIIIPTLLSNANSNSTIFAVDIKGELSEKGADLSDKRNIIFNPRDKSTYGYNPFWRLDNESYSEQLLYETLEQICFSLLPTNASEANPYWTISGRSLLLGLMMFEYRLGNTNLIDIIDQIQSTSIEDLLKDIKDAIDPSFVEYRILSQFFDLADTTLSCIYSTAMQNLSIFTADESLRYAFRNNPNKMNPSMLEEGKNIFLSIPEEYLEKYATILHLIINQSFHMLCQRPENAPPICYIIDEVARIMSCGRINSLLDAARTLRSRRVSLLLVVQSIEALSIAFSNNETIDLVSNCPYIVVLSASSEDTIRKVCSWVGQYMAPHYSYAGTGADAKVTISYNEKNIIDGMELITLAQTGESIVITPYGYCRLEKAFYFKDKYLLSLHKKIAEINAHLVEQDIPDAPQTENTSSFPAITETMKESLIEWDESLVEFEDIKFDEENIDVYTT